MNAPFASAAAVYEVARAKPAVDAQFEELFDRVDDLIKRVADTENPEIRKIRAKVHASMVVARSAYQERSRVVHRTAPPVDSAEALLDEEYSGPALGVALLVGVGLGVIMSSQP
jgi:ElaB/YqjD/DUF883 family membrane-anchored ribosome-binding protein